MQKISETIKHPQEVETSTPGQPKTIPSRSNLASETKENQMVYDFSRCLKFLEQKGRELYGNHFRIEEEDHNLIFKLLVYTIRDQANAERVKINLCKGIMLTGPVGCGKTSLMNLLRFFQPPSSRHIMKSCRDISFDFIRDGYEVIRKYSTQSYSTQRQTERTPKTYCFDDLGTEQNLKYYGNECNVMAEILLSRYDQFISYGMLTHITTNLSASEIENYYGNRVRSRMREMLNVVAFNKDSQDKRL